MKTNIAGSVIPLVNDVDYAPKWVNTSHRLKNDNANTGNGPGYWTPAIFAIHVIKETGSDIKIRTLADNIDMKSPEIIVINLSGGGSLLHKKYFYSLSVYDGTNWSYPSRPFEVNTRYGHDKLEINWVRTEGAVKQVLFRSTIYGTLQEKLEIDPKLNTIVDDGSLSFVPNDITLFGREVTFPGSAFKLGEVYPIYLRSYSGEQDLFMGYRSINTPIDLKLQYFGYGA